MIQPEQDPVLNYSSGEYDSLGEDGNRGKEDEKLRVEVEKKREN